MHAVQTILAALTLSAAAYAQGVCSKNENCSKATVVVSGSPNFGITNGICIAFYNGDDCFDIGCGDNREYGAVSTLVSDGKANLDVTYGTCHADYLTKAITGCAAGAHFETSEPVNC